MIASKTRNANGSVTQQGNLIPNGVKCNEKRNWVSIITMIAKNIISTQNTTDHIFLFGGGNCLVI